MVIKKTRIIINSNGFDLTILRGDRVEEDKNGWYFLYSDTGFFKGFINQDLVSELT